MTPQTLIAELSARGFELWAEGSMLHYRAPHGTVTPELLNTLKAHKPDILRLLTSGQLRPIFEYVLADNPAARLIMLGCSGQTPEQARASIQDRFGAARVVSVELYQWPPAPPVLH